MIPIEEHFVGGREPCARKAFERRFHDAVNPQRGFAEAPPAGEHVEAPGFTQNLLLCSV
jgi:hypothetical protein